MVLNELREAERDIVEKLGDRQKQVFMPRVIEDNLVEFGEDFDFRLDRRKEVRAPLKFFLAEPFRNGAHILVDHVFHSCLSGKAEGGVDVAVFSKRSATTARVLKQVKQFEIVEVHWRLLGHVAAFPECPGVF